MATLDKTTVIVSPIYNSNYSDETLIEDLTDIIENIVKEWITSKEIGFGKVMQPFRLSLVGTLKGPHLFDIAAQLGKEEILIRIETAIKKLG